MMERLLIAIVVVANLSFGQQVGLSAKTDSANYRIGDRIVVHVEGNLSAGIESITPALRDSLGPFEVENIEREGTNPRWRINLMTLDSGKVFIPPIPFSYRVPRDTVVRIAYTNSIFLNLAGIQIDPQGDIKDIKPPVSAPWKFEDVLPYLIALVLLAAAGYGYYHYRKRQQAKLAAYVPQKPSIAPHTAALFALRELEDKKLWQNGKVKQYYSEATEIVRRFFEGRWHFIALELTSDEILREMKQYPESERVWSPMQTFFLTADLVKFAKYEPTPEENANELNFAYDIVRAMTPSPLTVEEEKTAEVNDAR
jgi:hypothetical protein